MGAELQATQTILLWTSKKLKSFIDPKKDLSFIDRSFYLQGIST